MNAAVRFTPVQEITAPLTVTLGLSGASGTGKTYTGLLVARGMAEAMAGKGAPIGFVDTENRRALHYREAFPEMCHFDMKAVDEAGAFVGFGPERWIEVIDAAEAADLPVVVIDSFSHAWEGVGGVLDLHAETLDRLVGPDGTEKDRERRSQLAWAQVKPRYRRLIDRIVRAECHIVICTRAKPVMQKWDGRAQREVNARKTKTRRQDVPWDPAADGDLMFEMTAMMILDPSSPGCPVHQIKCADQFKTLFDPAAPMGEHTGRAMVDWAKGQGAAQREKELMDAARAAARGGRDAAQAHWSGLDAAEKAVVKRIMDEIIAIANRAEEEAAGGGNLFETKGPSPEEMARAEQEAMDAIRQQEREAS